MLPYEPWNQDIVMVESSSMVNEHAYYIQFMAPTTGYYTQARMLLGPSGEIPGGSPHGINMGIYDNSGGIAPTVTISGQKNHGVPYTKLGQGSTAGNPGDNNYFIDITFTSNIPLTANELYWFAFSWDAAGGGPHNFFPIHDDYNKDYNSVLHFNDTSAATNGIFKSIITASDINTHFLASENACWFRLYDNDSSFLVGPMGPTGPTGPQGLDGANSHVYKFSNQWGSVGAPIPHLDGYVGVSNMFTQDFGTGATRTIFPATTDGDGVNMGAWFGSLLTHVVTNGGTALGTIMKRTDPTIFEIGTITGVTNPSTTLPDRPHYQITWDILAGNGLLTEEDDVMISWVLNGDVDASGNIDMNCFSIVDVSNISFCGHGGVGIDLSCNTIVDVSSITFCDGPVGINNTYIGPGTSFDISTNQVFKIKVTDQPNALVVDQSGNVGINTANPQVPLHVFKDLTMLITPISYTNDTAILTGLGTQFLTDISSGDVLTLNNAAGNYTETRTVFTVDSDTQLHIADRFSNTVVSGSMNVIKPIFRLSESAVADPSGRYVNCLIDNRGDFHIIPSGVQSTGAPTNDGDITMWGKLRVYRAKDPTGGVGAGNSQIDLICYNTDAGNPGEAILNMQSSHKNQPCRIYFGNVADVSGIDSSNNVGVGRIEYINQANDSAESMRFHVNDGSGTHVEALRISSGTTLPVDVPPFVGINTTTPACPLDVSYNATNDIARFSNSVFGYTMSIGTEAAGAYLKASAPGGAHLYLRNGSQIVATCNDASVAHSHAFDLTQERLTIGGIEGTTGQVVRALGDGSGGIEWGTGSGGDSSGNAAIPYEPYNQNIMLSQWTMSDTWIHYVQFTCPSTANYTNLTFFTSQNSTTNYNGTAGVAIYSNTPGFPGTPNSRIAEGKFTFTSANMDLRYIDISFNSVAPLTADTLYWVAIAADHGLGHLLTSGFHNDYNSAYNFCRSQNGGFNFATGFTPAASGTTASDNAYWFRIYNKDAVFLGGPIGPTGPIGPSIFDSSGNLDMSCNNITDVSSITFCENIVIEGSSTSGSGSAIAIGSNIPTYTHPANNNVIAIGNSALGAATIGDISDNHIAIGAFAGNNGQSQGAIAIGYFASHSTGQAQNAIAIGNFCAATTTAGGGEAAISIGYIANDGGAPIAGPGDHAIGLGVDTHAHGTHSICIGRRSISDFSRCIVINAQSTGPLEAPQADTLTIKPIRQDICGNILYYDNDSGEITWDTTSTFLPVPYQPFGISSIRDEVELPHNFGTGQIMYFLFHAPSTAHYTQVTFLSTSLTTVTGLNSIAGIYTNVPITALPGRPQTLIGATSTLGFSAPINELFTATFTAPIPLTKNTAYWLAVASSHAGGQSLWLGAGHPAGLIGPTIRIQDVGVAGTPPILGNTAPATSSVESSLWFRIE